jgi:hypothetical protein
MIGQEPRAVPLRLLGGTKIPNHQTKTPYATFRSEEKGRRRARLIGFRHLISYVAFLGPLLDRFRLETIALQRVSS